MNKKVDKIEYLKTFGWSVLISLAIVFIITVDIAITYEDKRIKMLEQYKVPEDVVELNKLYELEKEFPDSYTVNLKIAMILESQQKYNRAYVHYKRALTKSNNKPYVIYKISMFFAKRLDHKSAMEFFVTMPDIDDSNVYKMRANFYSLIGHNLLVQKDYVTSLKYYTLAYRYARNSDKTTNTVTSIAFKNAYVIFSNELVEQKNIKLAIEMLKRALEIMPDPAIDYKLALIYMEVDKVQAQEYMEKVLDKKPEIINLKLYYDLLSDLVKEYEDSFETEKLKYYKFKQEQFKRKVRDFVIFKDDILIDDYKVLMLKKGMFKQEKPYAVFSIKNNTQYSLKNLYMKLSITTQSGIKKEIEQKLVRPKAKLAPMNALNNIIIDLEIDNVEKGDNTVKTDIYIRKSYHTKWYFVESNESEFVK